MNKFSKYLFLFLLPIVVLLVVLLIRNQDTVSNREKSVSEPESNIDNWAVNLVGFDTQKENEPIKIAILDSGINKKHNEFKGLTFKEYNAIEPGKEIVDDFGHGTAIAGIIAARGIKTTGVIHNVILYDVKVLNEKGGGKINDVIEGIEWCIKKNVDIINISFGFSSEKEGLKEAIDKAINHNIIITAASGNTLGLTVDYPAKYHNVLSISSFDEKYAIRSLFGYR